MRPIDADALMDDVEQSLQKNPHKDGAVRVAHRTEHMHFLDLIRKAPTIAPPPNEPLTLEQLQERNCKPIWVKELTSGKPGYWEICTYNKYDLALYGATWLAYDHESEEDQKDKATGKEGRA